MKQTRYKSRGTYACPFCFKEGHRGGTCLECGTASDIEFFRSHKELKRGRILYLNRKKWGIWSIEHEKHKFKIHDHIILDLENGNIRESLSNTKSNNEYVLYNPRTYLPDYKIKLNTGETFFEDVKGYLITSKFKEDAAAIEALYGAKIYIVTDIYKTPGG